MPTYSAADLEKLKETDAAKYFYYSNEEYFRDELGINLDSPNWEAIILPMGERYNPGDDKYEFFYNAIHGNGIRFLDRDGDVTFITEDPEIVNEDLTLDEQERRSINHNPFKLETIAAHHPSEKEIPKLTDKYAEYGYDDKVRKPASLGFGHWFMWYLTFGHWNQEAHQEYEHQLSLFDENEQKRAKAETNYQLTVLDPIAADDAKMAEFIKTVDALGSSEEKRKAYRTAETRRLKKVEEDEKSLNNGKSHVQNTMIPGREFAAQRLDYLMGPAGSLPEAEAVHKKILTKGPLKEDDFPKIPDVKVPGNIKLTAHQIAVLGYAMMSSDEVMRKGMLQDDLTKPVPDVQLDDNEKMIAEQQWYMHTESFFTYRLRPNSSYAVHWLAYAKQDLSQALAEYAKGDATKLGICLKQAIERTAQFAMFNANATDDVAIPDYCNLMHDMLAICDKNEDIREAVMNAGLTQEQITDAKIVSNMSEIWNRGIEAENKLASGKGANSPDVIADLMALRLMQSTMAGLAQEIKNGPEYSAADEQMLKNIDETVKVALKSENPEDQKKQAEAAQAYGAFADIGCAMRHIGVKIKSNDNIRQLFSDVKCADRLHEQLSKTQDVQKLTERTSDEILTALLPENARTHVNAVTAEINKKVEEKNPVVNNLVNENVIARNNSRVSVL